MPQYLITYLGGDRPSTPEAGQQHFTKYKEWLFSLGDAVISPMNPLRNTTTVGPDGSVTSASTTAMSGFTIIEADSIEAAVAIAQVCPFLELKGCLEVSELIKMSA